MSSYEGVYDSIRSRVERAALISTPSTTIGNFRHISHDCTSDVMRVVARAVRELESVDLESVLFILGERP